MYGGARGTKHRGAPVWRVKKELMKDFAEWCQGVKAEQTPENMIEFLLQKWFIKGKEFNNYCDGIEIPFPPEHCPQPMREGYLIPTDWIGRGKRK